VPTYATRDDLLAFLREDDAAAVLPAKAGRLLRKASALVTRSMHGALYDTDAEGMPLHGPILAAFREATCTQAAALAAAGIDPDTEGLRSETAPVLSAKSLGPKSEQYAVYEGIVVGEAERRLGLLSGLTDEARAPLDALGLYRGVVVV
jgi:hypothetical protein